MANPKSIVLQTAQVVLNERDNSRFPAGRRDLGRAKEPCLFVSDGKGVVFATRPENRGVFRKNEEIGEPAAEQGIYRLRFDPERLIFSSKANKSSFTRALNRHTSQSGMIERPLSFSAGVREVWSLLQEPGGRSTVDGFDLRNDNGTISVYAKNVAAGIDAPEGHFFMAGVI